MSPKRITPARNIETRISLPPAIHEAARVKAGRMSLRAWIAALVARDVGMSKAYRAPQWGGDRHDPNS